MEAAETDTRLTAEVAEHAEGEERRRGEFNTKAQRSEKIELRFRSGEWPIPFRTAAC